MKKIIVLILALCLCTVLSLTSCTKDKDVSDTVSKKPEVSKNETSKPINIPDVSFEVSVEDTSIIPDVSDMFKDESTVGEYSNGILQESEQEKQ